MADGGNKEQHVETLPPFLMLHPFGNPNSTHAARALLEAGVLRHIITSFDIRPGTRAARLLSYAPNVLQELCKRRDWIPDGTVQITTYPWPELKRLLLQKTGLQRRLSLQERALIDEVCMALDTFATAAPALADVAAVYGYEDMCASLFHSTGGSRTWRVYELTSRYYKSFQDIIEQEMEAYPELASSVPTLQEPADKLKRKDVELEEADLILVPSMAMKQSLALSPIDEQKVQIVPYGAEFLERSVVRNKGEHCRFLFAGRQSVGKGVHRLLEAFSRIDRREATLVLCGHKELPESYYARYQDAVINQGQLSYQSMQEEYAQASILVLPTLSDAFGLVVSEAMSYGVPVLLTEAAGAADMIDDGVDGFIVPTQDTDALEARLQWCVEHPEQLREMGIQAKQKAQYYSWERYRSTLLDVLHREYARYVGPDE